MNRDEKYLIFAHYHSNGLIRKDIINFLNESKKYFTKIVFVSTKVNLKELKKISKKIEVIKRKNTGYDFYSYKIGCEYISKILKYNFDNKKFFFVNSSIL
ncbi:hypothetical protein N9T44_01465, partial [Candidatus Pelagibacter sp.]|nr:hypothetical protein [Candidatus Pelagibacter sp.]